MKKGNKTLKIAIAVTISIIILVVTFLIVYIKTDFLKNNKQLFFRYLSQVYSEEKGFSQEELGAYIEKRKNTPYKDEGGFEVNVTSNENEGKYRNLNNCNFRFYGKVDTQNNKAEQNISINYADSAKFPIIYKQIGDKIGLEIEAVGNKSIIIKDHKSNLKTINGLAMEAIREDTMFENDNQENEKELSKDEKKNLQKSFAIKLINGLDKEKFTLVQEKQKGYRLEITEGELKDLLNNILEQMQNENQDNKNVTKKLKDLKEEVNEQLKSRNKDKKIIITVYKNAGMLSAIKVETKDIIFEILKGESTEGMQYTIKLTGKDEKEYLKSIELKLAFKGLIGLENVYENISLILKFEDKEYNYKLNNTVKFTDSVSIEEFTKENSVNLNEYKPENVMNFMKSVNKRLEITNKKLMAEIGVSPNENPLKYLIPSFEKENSEEESTEEQQEEEIISTLNSKYENYQGGNIKGVTVKGLLKTIIENNNNEEIKYKIEEINFKGEEKEASEENLKLILEEINNNKDKEYKIEFEKETDTGAIYRVIINEK